jgi:plasmid stability protein
MRTSLDLPDPLFRHLKARAALEGRSLRELVVQLLERGLSAPASGALSAAGAQADAPCVSLGAPLALRASQLSNAALSELLDG